MEYKGSNLEWALALRDISTLEQIIMIRLAHHLDHTGNCNPSITQIAEESSVSRRSVFRGLNALEDLNLLTRIPGTAKNTSKYILHRDGALEVAA